MKTLFFLTVLTLAFGSVAVAQPSETEEEATVFPDTLTSRMAEEETTVFPDTLTSPMAEPPSEIEEETAVSPDTLTSPVAEPHLPEGPERAGGGRWTAAESPYVIEENVLVEAGDSLIIEPGVTVQVSGFHQLKIQGLLIAEGTEDARIVFTSARSEPAPGDWWGLLFDGPEAQGILRHVAIQFVDIGVDARKSGPVTVTQSEVVDAKFCGMRWTQTAVSGELRDSRILRSHVGIMCKAGASPTIAGNTIVDNTYAGILCEDGSSPSIERNTLVRNRASGIACFFDSDPTISENLIARNGNGVSCVASSPRIVGCAIHDNEFSGVLCSRHAAPSLSGSNIFGNELFDVRNVSDQAISAEDLWWGEGVTDPGVCIYDGEDRPEYGKVRTSPWRSAPYLDVPGQPVVESLALWADPDGEAMTGDEVVIGDSIWVTLKGTDGSPYTVDLTSATLKVGVAGASKQDITGHTLILYETSENSGLFQTLMIPSEARKDRIRFVAGYGDVLSIAADLDPTVAAATKVSHRPPEITHLTIEGAEEEVLVQTGTPRFAWEYSDPEGDPQAQFEVVVSEEPDGAGAKVWAPGPIASSDSEMVYEGQTLEGGKTYFVRVRAHDGFSWGAWTENSFHVNSAPSASNLIAPPNEQFILRLPPRLTAGGARDPDGDALAYSFELYYTADLDPEKLAGSSPEPVPATGAETVWLDLPRLLENTKYWWRARATDGVAFGPWSEVSAFYINTMEEDINPFSLRSPEDGSVVETLRPTFQWERTYDPDPLQEISYAVFYSADSTFAETNVIKGLKKEIGEKFPESDLTENTVYYWMVAAVGEDTLQWDRDGTWSFFVNTANDPPKIRPIPEISFAEDTQYTALDLDAYVFDPDHPVETLTWTCSSDPDIEAKIGKGNIVTLTPKPNFHGGPVSFVVTATDPEGDVGRGEFSVTVLSVNDPPVASPIPDMEIEEDTATRLDLSAYVQDIDHDLGRLGWTSQQGPDIQVEIQGSVAKIRPVEHWNGAETIAFSVTDPEGGENRTSLKLTVKPVNDPPVMASIPPTSFSEDGSFEFSLDDYVSDVDHRKDELSWTAQGDAHLTVQINAVARIALLTAPPNWHGEPETVSLVVKDPMGAQATGSVAVTVASVNDPPVISEIPDQTFDEDTALSFDLNDFVKDIDHPLPQLRWQAEGHKTIQVAIDPRTHEVTMTAPQNWYGGPERITFTVTDPEGGQDRTETAFTVASVIEPPAFARIPKLTFDEDGSASLSLDDQLSDPDHPNEALTITLGKAEHVIASFDPTTHVVAFSAPKDWYGGPETLALKGTDPDGASDEGTLSVEVRAVNDAPVLRAFPGVSFDEDGSTTLELDRYVTDVDDAKFSWTVKSGAKVGVRVDPATNTAAFSAPRDWYGTEEATFTVKDKAGASASGSVQVTVRSVNDPPVLKALPGVTFREDGSFDLPLDPHVSDVDHTDAQMRWSAMGMTAISVAIDPQTRVATFSARRDWNGSEQGTLTVKDPEGGTVQGEVTVQVTPVNDAPVLRAFPGVSFDEDGSTTLELDRYVTDVDDAKFSWTVQPGAKVGVRVDPATNTAAFSAPRDWYGTEEATFTVKDKAGASASGTIRVTVRSVNDPPVLKVLPAVTFREDGSFELPLDPFVSDVDHSDAQMRWSAMGMTAISVAIDPSTHVATLSARKDWNGSEQGTLTVRDAEGGTAQAEVTVQVTPVNDAPVLRAFPGVSFDEDGSTTLELDRYVTDVDDAKFSWTVKPGAKVGVRVDPATNTATFSAPRDWHGTDEATFTVKDKAGASASGTVRVTVRSVNDAPVFKALPAVTFEEDASFDLPLDPLVSDVDHTDAQMTWKATGMTAISVAIDPQTHVATFSARRDWNGSEQGTLTVKDPEGGTAQAEVTVKVTPVNDAPVLRTFPGVSFDEDSSTTLELDRYVSDVDDAKFSWTVKPGAKVGVRVDPATNVAAFSAPKDWHGTDEATFTVKDQANASASGTIRVTVRSVNDSPVLKAIHGVTFREDGSFDLPLDPLVSDVDHTDAQMTWKATGMTAVSVAIDPSTHVATLSARKDWNGSEQGTLTVKDPEGGTAQAEVTVKVTPVNDAPVLRAFPGVSFDEDGSTTLELGRYVTDVDDTELSWTVKSGAKVAVRVDPATNGATFSAPKDWHGTEEATFTVKDQVGASASGTIRVTVRSVNDPPVLKALPEISFVTGRSERLSLQKYVADADHPFSDLVWSVTGNVNVRVAFEGGEAVFSAAEGWTGSEEIELNVQDPEGGKAAASLRVTVKPAE